MKFHTDKSPTQARSESIKHKTQHWAPTIRDSKEESNMSETKVKEENVKVEQEHSPPEKDEKEEPEPKKAKTMAEVKTDGEGNSYFELSSKRRCTIKDFKGKSILIDLREVIQKCMTSYESPNVFKRLTFKQYACLFSRVFPYNNNDLQLECISFTKPKEI